VLDWLAWGSALGALAVVVRWWLRRVDQLGRRRAFPWISMVLLGAMTVGASAPGMLRSREERRLDRAASALVGIPVSVHCQALGSAALDDGTELGFVRYGADGRLEHQTLIKRDQCQALAAYMRSDKRDPTPAEVGAVHVLAHESMHMRNIADEALAECAAVQRDAELARLLGAPPAAARLVAVRYWRSSYPFMPAGYRSVGCRRGGRLDEHRPDPPW